MRLILNNYRMDSKSVQYTYIKDEELEQVFNAYMDKLCKKSIELADQDISKMDTGEKYDINNWISICNQILGYLCEKRFIYSIDTTNKPYKIRILKNDDKVR